jgi:hypothetical protein
MFLLWILEEEFQRHRRKYGEVYQYEGKAHFEIESAQLANEKKTAQAGDYSMRRCISEIIKIVLSTDEKYS